MKERKGEGKGGGIEQMALPCNQGLPLSTIRNGSLIPRTKRRQAGEHGKIIESGTQQGEWSRWGGPRKKKCRCVPSLCSIPREQGKRRRQRLLVAQTLTPSPARPGRSPSLIGDVPSSWLLPGRTLSVIAVKTFFWNSGSPDFDRNVHTAWSGSSM